MQHKSAGQWVMVVYSKEKLVAAAGPPWRGIETEKESYMDTMLEESPAMEVLWQ